jgi:hypothetical protein
MASLWGELGSSNKVSLWGELYNSNIVSLWGELYSSNVANLWGELYRSNSEFVLCYTAVMWRVCGVSYTAVIS